jgi:hypothetical protein
MTTGFGGTPNKKNKATVIVNDDEVTKLIKEYKKIKKYMKSSLYKIMTLDGTEKKVSSLLEEYGEDDIS